MTARRYELNEDFTNAFVPGAGEVHTDSGVWFFDGVGSENISKISPEANAPGIISLNTGTSINDTCRLIYGSGLSGSELCMANQVIDLSIRFRLSSTADVEMFAGLFDDPVGPSAATVGRYVGLSGGPNYTSFSAQGGTSSVGTGVAASTTFRTFRAKLNGAGNLGAYQVLSETGAILARGVHSANFVNGTPVFFVAQVKTLAAATKSLRIDRITLRTTELTR